MTTVRSETIHISKNLASKKLSRGKFTRLNIMIGGAAGDGIMSAGAFVTSMFAKSGYCSHLYTEYPSLIRGGHNQVTIRVADNPVKSQLSHIDILFAINKDTIDKHISEVVEGGMILYDPTILRRISKEDYKRVDIVWRDVPLRDLVKEIGGAKIIQMTVGLAAIFQSLGLNIEKFNDIIRTKFKSKPAIAELNVKASMMGADHIKHLSREFPIKLEDKICEEEVMIMGGNDAVVAGLIAGGINFFSGYPMSPATSVLEKMVKHAKEYGVMTIQAEDEIAAVMNVIGAAHAGARAVTATSGGGLSLMTEAIGLAGSAEIPIVIINVMRPGPSTGLPTWTGQGDLLFTTYLSQDSFPRIILTPGDIEECFNLSAEALNYAEEYQLPVFVLTDKLVGSSYWSTPRLNQDNIEIRTGKTFLLDDLPEYEDYRRFKLSDDGVSPRAIPGLPGNMIFKATGNEADEYGHVDDTAENRIQQMDKRMKKLQTIAKVFPDPKIYGADLEESEVTFFTWGSNKGVILDVVDQLKDKGINASMVHITHMWPFPEEFISRTIDKVKLPILVEQNFDAQLGQLIRNYCLKDIHHKILRYDGRPFDSLDIVNITNKILKNY